MIFEIEYSLEDLSATVTKLLEAIKHGPNIWLFRGEMGAGKTTLVREIGLQKKVQTRVQSPTFSLVNPYETEAGDFIYHFDLCLIFLIQHLQVHALLQLAQSRQFSQP